MYACMYTKKYFYIMCACVYTQKVFLYYIIEYFFVCTCMHTCMCEDFHIIFCLHVYICVHAFIHIHVCVSAQVNRQLYATKLMLSKQEYTLYTHEECLAYLRVYVNVHVHANIHVYKKIAWKSSHVHACTHHKYIVVYVHTYMYV